MFTPLSVRLPPPVLVSGPVPKLPMALPKVTLLPLVFKTLALPLSVMVRPLEISCVLPVFQTSVEEPLKVTGPVPSEPLEKNRL